MPRYIDTDRLDEIVQDLNEHYEVPITRYEYKRISGVLCEFPTADVVKVKHGKWVEKPQADGLNGCSICGIMRFGESNYCPNCGADMRERREL